ncbi:hypothetical protein [Deinococcus multiflagellatus]|uniref:Uncharacterized protein n=1 Tax=Deinococcus multiflagellatus TaxID=1656887 RepID=A0ABW1ZNR8_9DEIO|nr:hypothetical protein [Deinococcus multiflagellatus]MBZ9715623.1 hypothetical protein [Deinococcus multiflagellatus]
MTTDGTPTFRRGTGAPQPAGTWDWYGDFDPAHSTPPEEFETFSIGVFQWVAKNQGNGTKKSKIVRRFTAPVAHPEQAYTKALAFITQQAQGR